MSALLEKYADEGIKNIENAKILRLEPFDAIGSPVEIINGVFGGKTAYEQAIKDLEDQLYRQADG